MPADRVFKVMVSSTQKDLIEHRRQVIEAVQRAGMLPLPMEHLTAEAATSVEVSLRLVDEADVYLGVFGVRYGHVPDGAAVSITEMEYNRAVAKNKPRLIFLIDLDNHAVLPRDVETGPGAEKLEQFK